ncbi:hypothetical protein M3J09_011354 [Ascochyta lentis]
MEKNISDFAQRSCSLAKHSPSTSILTGTPTRPTLRQ